jgi:hypothetical protein
VWNYHAGSDLDPLTYVTSTVPDTCDEKTIQFVESLTGFRIRIHFLRIRIQRIRMEANTDTDPDPDPDPIRIQGFNDQKLKKNNS